MTGRRLTGRQSDALAAVRSGRITYGDPNPATTRRIASRRIGTTAKDLNGRDVARPTSIAAYAVNTYLLDGQEVYGQEHRTYSSLEERGWIRVHYDELPADDTGTCRVTVAETPPAAPERPWCGWPKANPDAPNELLECGNHARYRAADGRLVCGRHTRHAVAPLEPLEATS
jgi:hypothetical protein